MRKLLFKRILVILDAIELQGITLQETPIRIYEEMKKDNYDCKLPEIDAMIHFLHQNGAIKETANGIDLNPAPTIYAKSNQNSGMEALSLFETFLHNAKVKQLYHILIESTIWMDKKDILTYMPYEVLELLQQTILFEKQNTSLRFHQKLRKGLNNILEEYDVDTVPLVSTTLTALFTSTIVSHENLQIDYKNTNSEMIAYPNKDTILEIIPRRGIPHDRDETKVLQSFYKDTLFHEFNHACPICNINIPHMLIASHIKPFRDCAHIYEAIDHNNGLLLCRNHDYLFDQGYVTFDDQGYIIVSSDLAARKQLKEAYAITKEVHLSPIYLTKERRLFLQYHREHIYKHTKGD